MCGLGDRQTDDRRPTDDRRGGRGRGRRRGRGRGRGRRAIALAVLGWVKMKLNQPTTHSTGLNLPASVELRLGRILEEVERRTNNEGNSHREFSQGILTGNLNVVEVAVHRTVRVEFEVIKQPTNRQPPSPVRSVALFSPRPFQSLSWMTALPTISLTLPGPGSGPGSAPMQ